MARWTMTFGLAVLAIAGTAWGQHAGSGRMIMSPAPPTTVLPAQRTHNFLGTPAALPRRPFGFDQPLLLSNPVDITPPRVGHFGDGGRFGGGRFGDGRFGDGRMGGGDFGDGHFDGGSRDRQVGNGREFFDGTSLNVRGEASTGDVTFALTLGTGGLIHTDKFHHRRHGHTVFVNPWWWGYPWAYGYYSNEPRYPIDGPVVVYSNAPATPAAPTEAAPEEPLTESQRAALLLRAGDVKGAIDVLRAHLTGATEDAEALRLLGLALIVDDQPAEAGAMMTFAYERDRSMAHRPLSESNLYGGSRTLREALRRAVEFANGSNSASSWLLVSVLMQAEGRDARGAAMVERSHAAGLDEQVYQAMKSALGG
jgi:hypothetical protein